MGASREYTNTSDRIDCGSSSTVDSIFSTPGGTVMAWGYLTSTGDIKLVSKEGATTGWSFLMQNGTGRAGFFFKFSINQMQSVISNAYLNQWAHYCVTYNSASTSNRPQIYINGVAESMTHQVTPGGSATSDAATNLQIGNRPGNNAAFLGNIAYCQCFKRILSVAEINEAMIRPGSIRTNLVGYWPCLGSDSPERDLSGNGNTGTVTGATESFNGPPVRLF